MPLPRHLSRRLQTRHATATWDYFVNPRSVRHHVDMQGDILPTDQRTMVVPAGMMLSAWRSVG